MKQNQLFHENPEELYVNTEPNKNYYLPFLKEADPFEDREKSKRFQFLNGTWNFRQVNLISQNIWLMGRTVLS